MPKHHTMGFGGLWLSCLMLAAVSASGAETRDAFEQTLRPAFAQYCVKCHGKDKTKGKVNLHEIKTRAGYLTRSDLIKEALEAVEFRDMPPEDEPQPDDRQRAQMLVALRDMLRQASGSQKDERLGIRRLNRFQYNNAVRDLFEIERDIFHLQEKLMTRDRNHLIARDGRMPDKVSVKCNALEEQAGFKGVFPFPKDLRAQHGFDNQADQLTLSPLLLEAFLRLSVSILESPDFNPTTVGAWDELFAAPDSNADAAQALERRLRPFLSKAFRGPVDDATLERYVHFTLAKIRQGMPFADAMKKAASAVLSSPKFLYRADGVQDAQLELASRLSLFLWGSVPDAALLDLARKGELAEPRVLNRTIDRMLADPKIERFLDSFPSQWMQLENILASVPDPRKYRYFSFDRKEKASLHMVLEPLLLFDAVFVEDRPIHELIAPKFTYRSELLNTWYTSDLKPPPFDDSKIVAMNRASEKRRESLEREIEVTREKLEALVEPVKKRLLAALKKQAAAEGSKPVDLKPLAAWEFNGDLKDSVSSLHLEVKKTRKGKVHFDHGMVVLDRAFLQSPPLPVELRAKTMELWIKLDDINQRGGGAMTIQGPGDFFDAVVLGQRRPRHWLSSSNGLSRTEAFKGSQAETPDSRHQVVHLAMVYEADGTTRLYRNGMLYGEPYRKNNATFPKGRTSVLFGSRHLPPGGGDKKFLNVSIDRARLYDRALTAEEVAASGAAHLYVSKQQLREALNDAQRQAAERLTDAIARAEKALKDVPKPVDPNQKKKESQKRFENELRRMMRSKAFERAAVADPRYGGVITNAATMTMTSSPKRTLPIARGAWVIEVILNDPPPPPPNDVPPLNEDSGPKNQTIREKFAKHRENPSCAGCHSRLDPLGFALENFDITGRWRERYDNGRDVDASGTLMRKHAFRGVVDFKAALVKENRRFARAFTAHLLRFALARELTPSDTLAVDRIVDQAARDDYRLRSVIRNVILSDPFLKAN